MDSIDQNDLAGIGKLSRQRLSEVLRKSKGGCITAKTVGESLNVSQGKARTFLSAWSENGWLHRIRQGIYLPVDIKATSSNQIFIDPWIIANELFSPCYIAGWSAAQHWDFTEQIFESTVVVTSRHINGKNQTAGGLCFLIKKLGKEKLFGLKSIWREQIKIQLSDPHKTIVDMLHDPSLGGGIRSVIDVFQSYLSSSHFDPTILLEYAHRMNNRVIFKRLGFILSKLSPNSIKLIEHCKQNISQGNSQLDPSSKGVRLLKKWRLWIPEGFETELNWINHDR